MHEIPITSEKFDNVKHSTMLNYIVPRHMFHAIEVTDAYEYCAEMKNLVGGISLSRQEIETNAPS